MRLKRSIAISACILLALIATTTAASALTVTSISPNTATRGTTITATVTGTGFLSGAEIMIYGGGSSIYATGETLLSTTQVRCTLVIPSNAYLGSYAVYARNPGMTSWVYKTGAFVVRAAAADLRPHYFSVPNSVNSRNFPITYDVMNYGAGAAGAFVVRFYLSTDATITASDYYLGQRSFAGLGANANSPTSTTIAIAASSVPGGSYYVGMIVDAANQVPETSETNNVVRAYYKVSIPPIGKPDLASYVFDATKSTLLLSKTVYINNAVKNYGTGPAGAFTVKFYASTNNIISSTDSYLGSRTYSGLAAGQAGPTQTLTFTVPSAGTWYIGAMIDTTGSVIESNENNNVVCDPSSLTFIGLITLKPNLKPWVYSVGNGINSRSFTISNSVKNDGLGSAGAFYNSFYLSTDTTFSSSDKYLGTRYYSSGLAGGTTSSTLSLSVTVPASVPAGTYYVLSYADAYGAVAETSEADNVGACFYKVTIPAASQPDLRSYVFDTTKPSTLLTRTVYITNAVRNSGTAPAGAFTVRFYASKDNVITSADSYLGSRTYSGLAAGQIGSIQTLTFTVPSAGTWYIGALIDYYGSVSESNEGNNVVYDSSPLTYFALRPINP